VECEHCDVVAAEPGGQENLLAIRNCVNPVQLSERELHARSSSTYALYDSECTNSMESLQPRREVFIEDQKGWLGHAGHRGRFSS
jgi:hypothetical protein